MKSFAAAAALVSLVPRILALTVNTPFGVAQCQPQLLTWSDGAPPYYLSIIPGGQASAAPLKTFPTQNGNSQTWTVDIPGGTSITIALKDSTGNTAYSDKVLIQQGSDSSCLNGAGSSDSTPPTTQDTGVQATSSAVVGAATPAPATTTTPATGGPTRAATTAAPTTGANRSQSVTTSTPASTTTASRPATTNVSGAGSRFSSGNVAFIGFMGLLGAVFA